MRIKVKITIFRYCIYPEKAVPLQRFLMIEAREYIEQGVLIQEVDARFLDKDLVRTAELIDRHQPFVVLITHYESLL